MTYQIADEPAETGLRAYVVRPTAPLLAAMLAGAWLAWPWAAFNAIAMGSPTRRKELALCGAAAVSTAVFAGLLIALVRHEIITTTLVLRLALLAITAWKLGITYYIATVQEHTFHVYRYYGGAVRAAAPVLVLGALLRAYVLGLIDDPLWVIIVAAL